MKIVASIMMPKRQLWVRGAADSVGKHNRPINRSPAIVAVQLLFWHACCSFFAGMKDLVSTAARIYTFIML